MPNKLSLIIALAVVSVMFQAEITSAVTFNPDFIISDEEMRDVESMSLSDIELFLKSSRLQCLMVY